MTQDTAKNLFPVVRISTTAALAIQRCFNVDWQPRVVRQNKQPRASRLKNVDYAIPCFELARQLGEPTTEVAERLAVCMRDMLTTGLEVEAVAGFVNFELSPEYLRSAIKDAREWFRAPAFIGQPHKHHYAVIEPRLIARAPRQQITTLAYNLLDRLHELLRHPISGHFLLSDHSHETLAHITEKRAYRPLKKTDGRFVQNHELLSDERMAASIEQMRKWWTKHHVPLDSRPHAPYEIYTESALVTQIHDFLDGLQTTRNQEGIIRDEANKAVYFVYSDQAIPLRSANGLLFRAASVLYVVNQMLDNHKKGEKSVILVTQKMHPLIHAFVSSVDMHQAVTCFDPYVAKADVMLIYTSISTLPRHFTHVRAALNKYSALPKDTAQRTALLSLIDLPVELSTFMATNQLPGLFDALGNSVTTLQMLAAQHSVKVAAN